MRKQKFPKAFTLVELLIVVSILAMLAIYASQNIANTSEQIKYSNTLNEIVAMIKNLRGLALTGETVPDYTDFDGDKIIYPVDDTCSSAVVSCPADIEGDCQCSTDEKVLSAGLGIFIDEQLERGFIPFIDLHNNSKGYFSLSDSKNAPFNQEEYLDKADIVDQNRIISFENEKYSDFGIKVSNHNASEKTFIYTPPYGDLSFVNIAENNFLIYLYPQSDCVNNQLTTFDRKVILINKVSGIPEIHNFEDLDASLTQNKFDNSC